MESFWFVGYVLFSGSEAVSFGNLMVKMSGGLPPSLKAIESLLGDRHPAFNNPTVLSITPLSQEQAEALGKENQE